MAKRTVRTRRSRESHFSPSLNHRHLMDQMEPSMAYDGGDVKKWQRKLRRKVKELIGLPKGERVPLGVRSLWRREHELGTIEKIAFAGEPYSDVMAYVCLPREAERPYPFFVCLQGHTTGAHISIGVERDDVDWGRIGAMGNSGGGTISLFSAAVLPRLRFAMPSCYFCTFRDSIMSIQHCADNYVPGLLQYGEMADVMGLFAPRPVVLVAGREDSIFPIKGVRKAFRHLKEIYRAAGAEEHCHLVVGPEGHRFYADLAWKKMVPELGRR